MLWYILFAVFVILAVAWGYREDGVDCAFCVGVVSAMGFGILFLTIGSVISTYGPLHPSPRVVHPLVAISDSNGHGDRAYLFGGYYDQTPVYYYYERVAQNSYSRGYRYADWSLIIQDSESPSLVSYKLIPNKWLGFSFLTHDRAEFHVPPGSIQEQTVLDNRD